MTVTRTEIPPSWWRRVLRKRRLRQPPPDVATLRASPLFDAAWYLSTYPDVAATGQDPHQHYAAFGAAEERDPGPDFSTGFYLRRYHDVAGSGITPLSHYELYGRSEGRATKPERAAPRDDRPRVLFVSGIPQLATQACRIQSYADAARQAGANVTLLPLAEAAALPHLVRQADLVVLYYAAWSDEVAAIINLEGRRGRLLFDTDRLPFDARTLQAADFAAAPTKVLAGQIRRWATPCFVLPTGYDLSMWRAARCAKRPDGADFRIALVGSDAEPLAALLRDAPDWRLVTVHDTSPPEELAACLATCDVVVMPRRVGDLVSESMDVLPFVLAALAAVPTVASPTIALRDAIRDGESGLLADTATDWSTAIMRLHDDPGLRARMGQAAYHDVLWAFGPECRTELMAGVLEQTLGSSGRAARAFELMLYRDSRPRAALPHIPACEVILAQDRMADADVTIVVPLFNYEHYICEAMNSVHAQTLGSIDLVVVDDCSTDASLAVALDWMQRHATRFGRLRLLRHRANSGLGFARNSGFAAAQTRFVLPLDADNRLLPACAARCLQDIEASGAAFAYPSVQKFGDEEGCFSDLPYVPLRLAAGNFIDATALIRVAAWAAAGGYDHVQFGWEDYDFWCRVAERGGFGQHVPEILVEYRVHHRSMLRETTDEVDNKQALIYDMQQRHSWILRHMGLETSRRVNT